MYIRTCLIITSVCCSMLLNSGCIWSRVKVNDTNMASKALSIRPGETKANELIRNMGQPPSSIIPLKNGKTVYVYNSSESKKKGFNLIIIAISKTNVRSDSTYFLINAEGVVEKVSSAKPGELPWEWWAFDK